MSCSIIARDVCVDFPVIGAARSFRTELFRSAVGGLIKRPGTENSSSHLIVVEALKNLNFELRDGDSLGLIGHNGAGKSTLLRTMAGCYIPTGGVLETRGHIMPLLSLGVGMDGDFSGYENIALYGLHLGMTRKEVEAVTNDIIEFTELGDFINLPLRTYSSGMQLRLTFAIATAFHPDILLIDELFGVGDASFFKKAEARMERMLERSKIFVLASHSNDLIRRYCTKGMVLDKGEIAYFGSCEDAINVYKDMVQ